MNVLDNDKKAFYIVKNETGNVYATTALSQGEALVTADELR